MSSWLTSLYNVTLKYKPLLKRVPISFNPSSYYTCTGDRRKDDYSSDTTEFHKIQEQYWEPLIRDRNQVKCSLVFFIGHFFQLSTSSFYRRSRQIFAE